MYYKEISRHHIQNQYPIYVFFSSCIWFDQRGCPKICCPWFMSFPFTIFVLFDPYHTQYIIFVILFYVYEWLNISTHSKMFLYSFHKVKRKWRRLRRGPPQNIDTMQTNKHTPTHTAPYHTIKIMPIRIQMVTMYVMRIWRTEKTILYIKQQLALQPFNKCCLWAFYVYIQGFSRLSRFSILFSGLPFCSRSRVSWHSAHMVDELPSKSPLTTYTRLKQWT